jgi:hypothetical protein
MAGKLLTLPYVGSQNAPAGGVGDADLASGSVGVGVVVARAVVGTLVGEATVGAAVDGAA